MSSPGKAAGVGANLFGTVAQLNADKQAADANARAALTNAAALDERAKETIRIAEKESQLFQEKGEVLFGDSVSAVAIAGVDISGSPLLALAETKRNIDAQTQDILTQGENEAKVLRIEAAGLRQQARDIKKGASAQAQATVLTGIAGLFG